MPTNQTCHCLNIQEKVQEKVTFITQKVTAQCDIRWGKLYGFIHTMFNMWCVLCHIVHKNCNLTLGNDTYYIVMDETTQPFMDLHIKKSSWTTYWKQFTIFKQNCFKIQKW